MRLLSKPVLVPVGLWFLAVALHAARPEEERAVAFLYDQWKNGPANATSVVQAADEILPRLAPGPWRDAGEAFRTFALLEAGQTDKARLALEALHGSPSTAPAVAEWCKRWLTRLDREKVREALRASYRREIRFPESLAPLAAISPPPPMTDRWGAPWRYRLSPPKRIPGITAQSYLLESPSLGRLSDLAAALAQPRPESPSIRPVGLVPQPGQTMPLVRFETIRPPVEQAILAVRSSWKGVTLLDVGETFLLLAENDYLFVLRRPER
jgi:hypothetical protein